MAVTLNASTSTGYIQTADTSGDLALQSNGTTQFNVTSTGAYGQLKFSTAVASTSGTSIEFTNLPSWVKRITVMFSGVSLSSTAQILVQLGTGSTPTYTTSGYVSTSSGISGTPATSNVTSGFNVRTDGAGQLVSGTMTIINITGNSWVSSHSAKQSTTTTITGGGDVTLGGVLTAIRITSTSTDTFDAGSINILYEG